MLAQSKKNYIGDFFCSKWAFLPKTFCFEKHNCVELDEKEVVTAELFLTHDNTTSYLSELEYVADMADISV